MTRRIVKLLDRLATWWLFYRPRPAITRQTFIGQQMELGLTRPQAEYLASEFERLEGFQFSTKKGAEPPHPR